MTYLDRASELQDEIRHNIGHSEEITLNVVNEWNEIITDVMYGEKHWDDEYR